MTMKDPAKSLPAAVVEAAHSPLVPEARSPALWSPCIPLNS